ncbi:MAG: accessory gene regulator B family protein [Ruminiclostridium sp.]
MIADFFVANGENSNYEIICYGIEITLSTILNIAIVIACGIFSGMVFESILFFVTLASIRMFSGGFHADTYLKCNLILLLNTIVVLLFEKIVCCFSITVIRIIQVFSIIFIFIVLSAVAPCENKNKPIDDIQRLILRKRCLICTTIISIVSIFLSIAAYKFAVAVSLGMISVSISMIADTIINRKG